ncbi:sulfite exporter TauE/SafE family protein [Candidatus Uhrbacteria bacterium]|nr:sulfite exporter TauE/SafE family protein [Candidatus Uhrbacteria bacterium]
MTHKKTFHVSGTSCASCEILIERELRKLPGVRTVHVSHSAQSVVMELEGGVRLTAHDLNGALKGHHYRFTEEQKVPQSSPSSGPHPLLLVALVVLFYLLIRRAGWIATGPDTDSIVGLGAVFGVGLLAAFSTCTAVVSGLVVAVSSATREKYADASVFERLKPHILFNLGRVIGFGAFGALIGFAGKSVALSPFGNGVLVIAVAIFMVLLGANLLEFSSRAIRPPKWLSHRVHDLAHAKHPLAPALLGAATFFLPCGFTQSMQLYALSTGNPTEAALVMMIFALGTAPALLGLGAALSGTRKAWTANLTKFIGAFVLALGLFNAQNGLNLVGIRFEPKARDVVATNQPVLVDGKQVVQMEVTSDLLYQPRTVQFKAGIPAVWEIYAANRIGCARTLIVPGLGMRLSLRGGYNRFEFTPPQAGVYPFTCSMGMTSGTLIVNP